MTQGIIIIGIALSTYSSLPYIRDILRGVVRPRIASWIVWTILAGVMAVSSWIEGQVPSALLSTVTFAGCATILALGWRRGSRALSLLDIICLIGALVGLASLAVLRDPAVAIFVSVAVDAIAFIPTFVHGWTDPEEESLVCFSLASAGAACALVAALLHDATLSGLAYPLYAVLFNGAMAAILFMSPLLSAAYEGEEIYE